MTKTHFTGRAASAVGPATGLSPVTPSDTADLPDGATRSLFVGTAGSVAVLDMQGNPATLTSGPSQYHPVRVQRVLATGTTATGIVALY